jgi:C-terminal processing protease CtpA/Prc
MTLPKASKRVERLVRLCKLWGAVKYFHPYLAYRDDIDWDAALVAAIPKVSAAKDAGDYAAAVQDMLAALGDPVTQVIDGEPADTASPPHESQPSYTFTPDGILVVTVHDYQDLSDFFAARQKMAAIKAEISKARGVLFDLRAAAPVSYEMRVIMLVAFQSSEIASVLSSTPLMTAGERTRMHVGFAPQISGGGFPYTSAFQIADGRRISPAPEARDIPVVFLINGWSPLPPEALALQIAGKAVIIVEGSASDASLGVKTHSISLGDGVVAQIRLGEIISEDGAGGFLPNRVIPPAQLPGEGDAALNAALELLQDFKPSETRRTPLPTHAAPMPENSYPEMAFPPLENRLLAAFRIWTVINYFFPYKDLIEEDWDGVLAEFIPRMEQADSALSYNLAVVEMVTHIHDSHGDVWSPVLEQHLGAARPPIRLQIVEGAPVITAILDEESAKAAGVRHGDVVLKVDGEDAMGRIAGRAKYMPASTPQSLMYMAALDSLAGPEGSPVILTIRDREQRVKEVRLPRKAEYGSWFLSQRSGEVVRLLGEDIGYVDLDRLQVSEVDEMFERLKDTKAIVFDMRGYPRGTAWSIAPRLTEAKGVAGALFQRPFVTTPDESQAISYTFVQPLPPTEKWRYKGKTVMLIDERAMSQAEHTGLFFEAANDTRFVGSHTGGVNGDQTSFCVPGGIIIMFTGQAVRHADGRQLQRIGLVPDVEVRPTIEGIQNGKDEVLEAAIQYLQRSFLTDQRDCDDNRQSKT